MSLGGRDKKAEDKARKKQARLEREKNQKQKYEAKKKEEEERQKGAVEELNSFLGEGEEEMEEGVIPDEGSESRDPTFSPSPTPSPRRRHRRVVPPPLHMPRNVLSHKAVQRAITRNKMSSAAAVDLVSAVIVASNGNLKNYFLNAGNATVRRSKGNKTMAAEAKEKFVPPDPCILLWDEKRIERNKQEEVRMVVMVAGDERPPNMIGSFPLPDGKGSSVAEAVVKCRLQ